MCAVTSTEQGLVFGRTPYRQKVLVKGCVRRSTRLTVLEKTSRTGYRICRRVSDCQHGIWTVHRMRILGWVCVSFRCGWLEAAIGTPLMMIMMMIYNVASLCGHDSVSVNLPTDPIKGKSPPPPPKNGMLRMSPVLFFCSGG